MLLPVLAAARSVDFGSSELQISSGPPIGALIFAALFGVVIVASMWRVFAKAGLPGWSCLVPIYNVIQLVKISGKPMWWVALFFIPGVNVIAAILIAIAVANNFGKGTGFGLGLAFLAPIFYPILGFGSARYRAV